MRTFRTTVVAIAIAVASSGMVIETRSMAGGERCRQEWLTVLARDCAGQDTAKTADAIAQLRTAGQDGLNALCDEHDRVLAEHMEAQLQKQHEGATLKMARFGTPPADLIAATADEDQPRIARLRGAIDAVAKQRDAWASRLYWHTDLSEARSLATASGKPILSLRMLGNLDEDRSCANSRFFRSILYANKDVSNYLREHFILHWESLRPVPRLTVDFGDGRRIDRTITGNSIHYVLDSSASEIIDALPGLYGPAAFLRGARAAETAMKTASTLSDADNFARTRFLQRFHMDAASEIDRRCDEALEQLQALDAAAGKSANATSIPSEAWQGQLSDEIVARLAGLPSEDRNLDQGSTMLIRSKVPVDFLKIAEDAQKLTASKRGPEAPVVAMFRTLQRTIAEDTVRNEYTMHRRIHNMLMDSLDKGGIAGFNNRVYAELFLTPLDDPWMGLAPRDAYVAIDDSGLIDGCLP